jgi:molybdopterin molybdotransferase
MASPSVEEAFATWIAAVATLPAVDLTRDDCLGLVLAADAIAPHDLPSFPRAMMDGYAVRLDAAGKDLPIAAAQHAGDTPSLLPAGAAMGIMTGAVVPEGAEAVVERERCNVVDGRVTLPERIRPNANIVPRGGEALTGAVVLQAGERITALGIAAAAALGITHLRVLPRPRVQIITTGSELRQDGPISAGAIRDSNGPMLAALCHGMGVPCTRTSVADDQEAIALAVAAAQADMVLLSGGVSAGDKDYVPAALADLGFATLVRGVDQKPGKPVLLAQRAGRLVAALPGNPLAVHWCFVRFVAPALRRLAGGATAMRREVGTLAAILPGSRERPWFVPARARRDGERLLVTPLPPVSSGDVVSPAHADAYVAIPAGAAPRAPGEVVEVLWCDA